MKLIIEVLEKDRKKVADYLGEIGIGVRKLLNEGEGIVSTDKWRIEEVPEENNDYLIYSNEGDTFPPYITFKEVSSNPQILGIAPGDNPDEALGRFLFSERGSKSLHQGFKRVVVRKISGKAHYRILE